MSRLEKVALLFGIAASAATMIGVTYQMQSTAPQQDRSATVPEFLPAQLTPQTAGAAGAARNPTRPQPNVEPTPARVTPQDNSAPPGEPAAPKPAEPAALALPDPVSTDGITALPDGPTQGTDEARQAPSTQQPPALPDTAPGWIPEKLLRLREGHRATLCPDAVPFAFSVAKQGTRAGPAIYVTIPRQSGRVEVGQTLSLSPDCALRLDRTGRTSTFYAEFTYIGDTDP